ncbi:FG-GAP-like repeat-containing protein [Melittangium boletus]|uniref:FG-GAP-like repeat-containing protein n=1 Tax=Melittangium boletus TaxID=83453 RepID=UPI003DA6AC1D
MKTMAMKWMTRATRSAWVWVGSAGLALTSASAVAAPPVLRLMPVGDSITFGVGSPTHSSYRRPLVDLLANQSRFSVTYVGSQASGNLPDLANEGHSGYIIDEIRAGIDGWMTGARPDVVLLHLGINDYNRGVDTANAPARLRVLIDRIFANKPGVTVLVMGLIPTTVGREAQAATFNSQVKAMESGLRQAGKKFRYVQPPALTAAELPDKLHPNDAGYARMAQAFHDVLNQAFTDGWVVGGRALNAGTESGTGKVRWADFDGDGRMDYLTLSSSGAVSVFLNRGGDGRGGWQALGQVAPGVTSDGNRVRFADFDGDGKADYLTLSASGAVQVYLNRGGDIPGGGGWLPLGQVAPGTTSDASRVRFADHDGDGKADYLTLSASGAVQVYLNRGGDIAGGGGWLPLGQVAPGTTSDASRVRFADLDGDRRADYIMLDAKGAVLTYLNRGGDGYGGYLGLGLTAPGVTANASLVSFADFTGDGNADYVVGNASTNAASVYGWAGGDNNGAFNHGGWIPLGQVAGGVSVP